MEFTPCGVEGARLYKKDGKIIQEEGKIIMENCDTMRRQEGYRKKEKVIPREVWIWQLPDPEKPFVGELNPLFRREH